MPAHTNTLVGANEQFEIWETYTVVKGEVTLEECQAAINFAEKVTRAYEWAVADVLLYAIDRYGEDAFAIYSSLSEGTLRNMAVTAKLWKPEWRVPGAAVSFHTALNSRLRDALYYQQITGNDTSFKLVRQWLVDAVQYGWTREQLQVDIVAYELPPSIREPNDSEVEERAVRIRLRNGLHRLLSTLGAYSVSIASAREAYPEKASFLIEQIEALMNVVREFKAEVGEDENE
jgi:hypothetical protein